MSDLIVIRAASVLRLAPFVSTEATRYYLNGYGICPTRAGGCEIVATDGHRLGMIHDPDALFAPETMGEHVILHRSPELLRAVKAAKELPARSGPLLAWVVIDRAAGPRPASKLWGQARVVRAATAADAAALAVDDSEVFATINGALIDGTFPDCRRVIPSADQVTGNPMTGAYNGKYLADFSKVASDDVRADNRRATGPFIRVFAGAADGPAIVRVCGAPDFVGVIMPGRGDINDEPLPSWFSTAGLGVPQPAPELAVAA